MKERYAKAACKVAGMILIIIMLLFALPVQSVSAARKDADTITLDISNIPEDAAYIDVLIDFENGENYTELNKENLKQYDFDADELAQYNEGGFVSYSCHFRGIKTDMKIKEGKTVFVDEKTERQFYFDHNSLKIAVLDKSGHIMQVSDTVEIKKNESHFGGTTDIYLAGDIKYDVGKNKVEPDMFDNSTSDLGMILAYAPYTLFIPIVIIALVVVFFAFKIPKDKVGDDGTVQVVRASRKLRIVTGCVVLITLAFAAVAVKFIFFSS